MVRVTQPRSSLKKTVRSLLPCLWSSDLSPKLICFPLSSWIESFGCTACQLPQLSSALLALSGIGAWLVQVHECKGTRKSPWFTYTRLGGSTLPQQLHHSSILPALSARFIHSPRSSNDRAGKEHLFLNHCAADTRHLHIAAPFACQLFTGRHDTVVGSPGSQIDLKPQAEALFHLSPAKLNSPISCW
jgi:hypothetical protein